MNDNLEAIQVLVQEILNAIKQVNENQNALCIKTGRIMSGSNGVYQVKINQENFTIKSKLSLQTNELVGVLTNRNLKGQKYILG